MPTLTKEEIAGRLLEAGIPPGVCNYFLENAHPIVSTAIFPESKEDPWYYRKLAYVIDKAFTWSHTPQGHTYWASIHDFLRIGDWPQTYNGFWDGPPPIVKKCSLPVIELNVRKTHA